MATNPVRKDHSVTLKEISATYRKKQRRGQKPDVKKVRACLEDFFKILSQKLVMEQLTFVVPKGLGVVTVKGMRTPKTGALMWRPGQKKPIRVFNLHTNGWLFYFWWGRGRKRFANKYLYHFKVMPGDAEEYTGKQGLHAWLRKIASDPYAKKYAVK